MKYRLWAVLWFLLSIGVLPALAQSGNISLITPVEQVQTGDTFTITIQVRDVSRVYGGIVELAYDPQALEVVQTDNQAVVPGDFFANQPGFPVRNSVDPVAGSIEYALTLRQPAEPVSGSGSLGTVQFHALRDGEAAITISEASLLSPRFEEVNGRTIARAVDEVPVEVQGLTLNVGGTGTAMIVQQSPQSLAAESQPAPSILAPQTVPATVPAMIRPAAALSPVVIAGIAFFMIGLLLFTFSVGTYVRLRRQYA